MPILGLVLARALWALLVMQSDPRASASQPLTICEVMPDLTAYNNQVVTIKGEYLFDPEHSSISATCKQHFTTFGYDWPSALQLRRVSVDDDPAKIPFVPDSESIESFHRAVGSVKALTVQGCIVATGMIRTKDDYSPKLRMSNGQMRGLGFGHRNAFPGQLILKSVRVISLHPYQRKRLAYAAVSRSRVDAFGESWWK